MQYNVETECGRYVGPPANTGMHHHTYGYKITLPNLLYARFLLKTYDSYHEHTTRMGCIKCQAKL